MVAYVSQTLSFMVFSLCRMIFTLKSTPIVELCDGLNLSSHSRKIRLDFPTPVSPTIRILN